MEDPNWKDKIKEIIQGLNCRKALKSGCFQDLEIKQINQE